MYFIHQNRTSSLQYKTNTCMNLNSVYRISLCDLNFNVIFLKVEQHLTLNFV